MSNLDNKTIRELLKLQVSVIDELRKRNVVRTGNNPLGDYTEWLVAKALGLNLVKNAMAGYDATSEDGVKIQIKGRRITKRNLSRQLGVIRNLDSKDFDELVAVVFDEQFDIIEAVSIPHALVAEFGTYKPHVNGYVLHVQGPLLTDSRIRHLNKEQLNATNC